MNISHFYLGVAIILEMIATALLHESEQLKRFYYALFSLLGYAVSFYFLSLSLKQIPLSIAYATWSGIGITLITIIGVMAFKQRLDWGAFLGIALIASGIVVINLFSEVKSL
jgi:small multidrug resistance pump